MRLYCPLYAYMQGGMSRAEKLRNAAPQPNALECRGRENTCDHVHHVPDEGNAHTGLPKRRLHPGQPQRAQRDPDSRSRQQRPLWAAPPPVPEPAGMRMWMLKANTALASVLACSG